MIIESANPVWWRVLGITPFTTTSQIENNYKTLLCYWHPDRNSHPNATEITAHLNRAYDCYQSFQEMSSQDNAAFWTKIRRWIPYSRPPAKVSYRAAIGSKYLKAPINWT